MVDVSVLRTRLYEMRFGYKKGGKFWREDLGLSPLLVPQLVEAAKWATE